MLYQLMHRYPAGSVVQHRDGYVHVKRSDGRWTTEHRLVAEIKIKGRELSDNERVFHMDGNRENNHADNLAVIVINKTRYRLLPQARALYIPAKKDATLNETLTLRGV